MCASVSAWVKLTEDELISPSACVGLNIDKRYGYKNSFKITLKTASLTGE